MYNISRYKWIIWTIIRYDFIRGGDFLCFVFKWDSVTTTCLIRDYQKVWKLYRFLYLEWTTKLGFVVFSTKNVVFDHFTSCSKNRLFVLWNLQRSLFSNMQLLLSQTPVMKVCHSQFSFSVSVLIVEFKNKFSTPFHSNIPCFVYQTKNYRLITTQTDAKCE